MDTAGQAVGKIETRLRHLGARLDAFVVKADEAGTEAKIDYRSRLDHIKDRLAVVNSRLNEFKTAHGRKWDDFKGAIETAWNDLENAFTALKQ